MASIVIKTPKRSINLNASKKDKTLFFDEIENNVSRLCLGKLAENVQKAYEDQIALISVFFQRVIARTPVDESYERVIVTKNGEQKTVKHTPDDEICREHWFIEDIKSGKKLYSKELFDGPFSFNVVNDSSEINKIRSVMKSMWPFGTEPSFSIGNDCKHYDRLEYGYNGWNHDTKPVTGNEIGREHAVKNKHSVQAPIGMYRVTKMEMDAIRRNGSDQSLRRRYKGGLRVRALPSDRKLKEFYELMKKSHRMKYADFKRFLEVY